VSIIVRTIAVVLSMLAIFFAFALSRSPQQAQAPQAQRAQQVQQAQQAQQPQQANEIRTVRTTSYWKEGPVGVVESQRAPILQQPPSQPVVVPTNSAAGRVAVREPREPREESTRRESRESRESGKQRVRFRNYNGLCERIGRQRIDYTRNGRPTWRCSGRN
jgi:type II secretory pathway pseudopilin PulG